MVLGAGTVLPSGSVPTIDTSYCVAGSRPVKTTAGVGLMTTTRAPPPSGLAVKVYCVKAAPGGAAPAANPVLALVSSAAVSTGASASGVVSVAELEAGVSTPATLAVALTS